MVSRVRHGEEKERTHDGPARERVAEHGEDADEWGGLACEIKRNRTVVRSPD